MRRVLHRLVRQHRSRVRSGRLEVWILQNGARDSNWVGVGSGEWDGCGDGDFAGGWWCCSNEDVIIAVRDFG